MNTDRLVDLLSSNLEPVSRVRFGKALLLAMLTGSITAFTLMLATVGPRADLGSTAHLWWTAVKLLFAVSVISTATPPLLRSMRPGLEKKTHPEIIFLPFLAAIVAALAMLLFVPPHAWERDASWSAPSISGAMSRLHHILCCGTIRRADLGASSRRSNSVKP